MEDVAPVFSNVSKIIVEVRVTDIVVNPNTLKLSSGDTYTLSATLYPPNCTEKGIEWKSGNLSLASVDMEGRVTTVSGQTGTVGITATSVDGGMQSSCSIVVIPFISVAHIKNVPESITTGISVEIDPIVEPLNSTNYKVEWSIASDNGTQATIEENTLTAQSEGNYGFLILRGVIKNGNNPGIDFVQDFRVSVVSSHVPVQKILGLEEEFIANLGLDLSPAIVSPSRATYKNIIWTIPTTASTGAYINSNKVWATFPGNIVLRATIKNGGTNSTDYVQDFPIKVIEPYYPVSDITLAKTKYQKGKTADLLPTVLPSNATYQNIIWTLEDPGTANATLVGTKVTTANLGTFKVKAEIMFGLEYGSIVDNVETGKRFTKVFTLTSIPPAAVENITGVPSILLKGTNVINGTITPTEAADGREIIWSIVSMGTTHAQITDNTLITTTPGTCKVRGTVVEGIEEGVDYIQDFDIEILDTIMPVTDLGIKNDKLLPNEDNTLEFVINENATFKDVTVMLIDSGSANAIWNGSTITATNEGDCVIRATIKNGAGFGLDYTKDITLVFES